MTTQQLLTHTEPVLCLAADQAWCSRRLRSAGFGTLVRFAGRSNPHQVDALFACRNPSPGVILADEVGLGYTIPEAGWSSPNAGRNGGGGGALSSFQRTCATAPRAAGQVRPARADPRSHKLQRDPANRSWETRSCSLTPVIICSYQFAKAKADDIRASTGTWSSSTKRIACATSATKPATSSPRPTQGGVARVHSRRS